MKTSSSWYILRLDGKILKLTFEVWTDSQYAQFIRFAEEGHAISFCPYWVRLPTDPW